MQAITIDSIGPELRDLLQTIEAGEEVMIMRGAESVAKVVPIPKGRPRQPGSAIGKLQISEDFDAPLPDFEEYQ